MKSDHHPPPDSLSARSKGLWVQLVPGQVRAPARRQALAVALTGLDRLDQITAALRDQPLVKVTASSGAVHLHPLIRAESSARRDFLGIWERLGLDREPPTR